CLQWLEQPILVSLVRFHLVERGGVARGPVVGLPHTLDDLVSLPTGRDQRGLAHANVIGRRSGRLRLGAGVALPRLARRLGRFVSLPWLHRACSQFFGSPGLPPLKR